MNGSENFTMKEIVIEIKDELKSFRNKYDEDQEKRDLEIAKRPTRAELWSSITVIIVIAGIIGSVVG